MGFLIKQIGELIIEYENSSNNFTNEMKNENSTKLIKAREVTSIYPALTLYSLNKAVKEEKISVIKIGNLNYFIKEDIEDFIKRQTIKRGNSL